MSSFEDLEKEFNNYNPLIFNLNLIDNIDVLSTNFDIQFSNNICYPEFKLGFQHYIHSTKDKMEIVKEYKGRKKIYLVTSLFEKNIEYKEKTNNDVLFTSLIEGINNLIKIIKPDFPKIINRAFFKMWEILIFFDIIPKSDNFVSSHLAEGPGSFIQAVIFYRIMQEKLGIIKSASKDNYYGITIHTDQEHLMMHQDFLKFFSKETPKRVHIMETKSIKDIKELYGGGVVQNKKDNLTNGDITKLKTINQYAGSNDKQSFSKPSDLITSDGGFDWKKENLQEQEAYRLIFSEIVAAIKIQKDGGHFVIKIFESYTKITIKFIELLKQFYKNVYLCKPYTSRISNSEKYLVCKGFNKSACTSKIISKFENIIEIMNKNESYQILDIFTDVIIPEKFYTFYKKINLELLIKQYVGIINIVKFLNLDNYSGIEFNEYLDKQIIASHFWNNLFLNSKLYPKIIKFFNKFNYFEYLKNIQNNNSETNNSENINLSEVKSSDEETIKKTKMSRSINTKFKNTKSKNTKSKIFKTNNNQKGGGVINTNSVSDDDLLLLNYDDSINSSDEIIGNLNSSENDDIIDLNNI
jgi:23S rRNA U2552 (ribose-2'-O)-methylase RlmE/FtsJ